MKCDIAPKAVELGHDDGRLELAGVRQRGGKLGTAVERIVALAGLDLGVVARDVEPMLRAERSNCGFLGLKSQAGLALLDGADPGVGHGGWHRDQSPI